MILVAFFTYFQGFPSVKLATQSGGLLLFLPFVVLAHVVELVIHVRVVANVTRFDLVVVLDVLDDVVADNSVEYGHNFDFLSSVDLVQSLSGI